MEICRGPHLAPPEDRLQVPTELLLYILKARAGPDMIS